MNQAPSPQVRLSLCGPPQITRADGATVTLRSRKHFALLAYLVVEQRHSASRDTLLALLWPEADEEAARNNLRVALADLRRALGEAAVPFLQTTRHTVQFDPASDHTLDVLAFRALLDASHAHAHASLETCAACLARLEQAAALYGGDFLHGFALPDSAPFEEWATIQREQLHQQALEALAALANAHEQQGDYAAQCRYARRQLALEPWREQAHRQLMRGLARAGDRRAALAQYEACRRVLAAELGIEPEIETAALYEQIRGGQLGPAPGHGAGAGRLGTFAPHDERTPPGTRLSAPPTLPAALIGRAQDVAAVCQLLRQADVRLLSLIGPGGVGKTSLALQVANALLSDNARPFADGVGFVDLSAIGDTELVAKTIAHALSVHETGDTPILARLKEYLHDRQLLLVLDNFEQVIAATPQVAELLEACPRLKALVTSRRALRLHAEHAFAVPALALPPLAPLPAPEALAEYGAVALFVERTQAVLPSFKLNAANARAVAEMCVRLDGLPLAIELAAARLRLLAPHDLLARLSEPQSNAPLRLLTKGAQRAGAASAGR